MTNYKRGDVILALFPDSNLRTAKKRPVLIVQADNIQTNLPQLIVAMITSNLSREGHPSRVLIEFSTTEGKQSGLLSDSIIATDNLATLHEKFIDKKIGSLSDFESIEKALANTFGLTFENQNNK
ncbi:MAG: type II toxin-antitoxin system PemK/MazF family toxin [Acidobacteriota bacterium]|jgi:mRNA interferase MazF|nr:type II toxin-antitoxin system PemK/MazF family toxin [Acidobacteriota bacterium]